MTKVPYAAAAGRRADATDLVAWSTFAAVAALATGQVDRTRFVTSCQS